MAETTGQVYGRHAVHSLLVSRPEAVIALTVSGSDQRLAAILQAAGQAGIPLARVGRRELDDLLPGKNHQGVMAQVTGGTCELPEAALPALLESLAEPAFLLVLDGIQDPHNLGACLRSADAAGVHAVLLPKDRAAGITPVVHKVACGAVQTMPVFIVTNLARTLRSLKEAGIWLYGAAGDASQDLYASDLQGPIALVLGSEGSGLRRLTRELCDHLVSIPMAGSVPSLNVSVAAGVLLFEARRQRGLLQS
jgi:23S rRNA (guanosine2251-2'-O)-methyltransferase